MELCDSLKQASRTGAGENSHTMADTATSYSPFALARWALSFYARLAKATIDTGWSAASCGLGLSERVTMALLGAATGGAQVGLRCSNASPGGLAGV